MPTEWRVDWLQRVRRNRAGKERALAEVEKALALIPESGRDAFRARNRQNTKVSLPELHNRFIREKAKIEAAEQDWRDEAYEGDEVATVDADQACEVWGDRYPGSPPIEIVRRIAEYNLPSYHLDRGAMDWQRAARLLAAACGCHDASVTSRPEYWLLVTRLPTVNNFSRAARKI
jgi:hypothetical protein